MLRKTDVLIGVIALLLLLTPPCFAFWLRRQPPDQWKILTETITPLLTKEIATTRVTLNSIQSAMHTEDRTFWDKYGGTIIKTLIGLSLPTAPFAMNGDIQVDAVRPATIAMDVAIDVPEDNLRAALKNKDKHCDAILYDTTVSLDYGIPIDQHRDDWIMIRDRNVIVRLPPPKVLGLAKVELAQSRRLDQQTNRSHPDAAMYSHLDQAALEDAQKHAESWAIDLGVNRTCRENSKAVVRSIFAQFLAEGVSLSVEYEDEQGAIR